MKKIGILGGTFDPVHIEHVRLATESVKELGLDLLLVMPTFLPPHKSDFPTDAIHRLNMLKLAFEPFDKIAVSDYEILKREKSYTYLTVEHFKSVYPEAELYFIVGGDMLTDFKTWKNPDRILNCCTLAVFDREDFYTDFESERDYFSKTFGRSFIKLAYVGKHYSATKVRVYSALDLDIFDEVPQGVGEYIKENRLYNGGSACEFVKTVLPKKRLIHTANVAVTALKKVKELGLDKEQVFNAAIYHDCAKYLDPANFKDFKVDPDMPKPVIHAFLGAHILENVLKIQDEEVIDAVRYHTTGKANMSTLSKLIFLADMLEEGRDYEGVEMLRQLYERNFDLCFKTALKEEVIHLENKGGKIYYETLNALKYYTENR